MTESRISQDIVDDVSVYWVIDDRPSMTGFAKKHGLNARTLRRWRYRGWLDLARFQESLFRDFAEELSKAQDERKQVDAEMKRIRDENKRSTSTLPEENASGRTKWGDVVSGVTKDAAARLWGVLPLSQLKKRHLENAWWNEPKRSPPDDVPDEWRVKHKGRDVDIRELQDDPSRFLVRPSAPEDPNREPHWSDDVETD